MRSSPGVTHNTVWLTVGYVLARALNVFIVALLSRYLGPAGYGELTLAYTYQSIFLVVANFGLDAVLIRESSLQPEKLGQIVGDGIWLKTLLAGGTFLGGTVLTLVLGYPIDKVLLTALASVSLFFSPLSLAAVVFATTLRLDRQARLNMLEEGLRAGFTLVVVALGGAITTIVLGRLSTAAIATAAYLWGANRLARLDLHCRPRQWWALLRKAAPMGITALLVILTQRWGHLIIERSLGDVWLGIYGPIYQLYEALGVLVHFYFASIYPLLSQRWGQGRAAFQRLYWLVFRYISIPALLVALAVTPLAGSLLGWALGPDYVSGRLALLILVWTQVLGYTGATFYYVCLAAGQFSLVAWLSALGLIVDTGLYALTVPRYGINGAALTVLLSIVWRQILLTLLPATRDYGRAWYQGLLRPALAAAPALLLAFLGEGLAFSLFAVGVFGLLLLTLGLFSLHKSSPLGRVGRLPPAEDVLPALPLEWTPCPLCGKKQATLLYELGDRNLEMTAQQFRLVRCEDCGMVWLNPHPRPEDMMRFYPPTYWQSCEGTPETYIPTKGYPYPPEEFALLSGFLHQCGCPLQGRILDIGCGGGEQSWPWRRAGWEVFGFDLSLEAVRRAQSHHHLPACVARASQAPFREHSFNVITLYSVLEHVSNPLQVVQEAARLLRPGGVVVILVPNIVSFQARFLRSFWYALDVPRHLVHFTPNTLEALLEQAGLDIVHLSHHSCRHNPAGYIFSLLPWHWYVRETPFPWTRRLYQLAHWFARRLARWEESRGSGTVMTGFAVRGEESGRFLQTLEQKSTQNRIDLLNWFNVRTSLIWWTGWGKRVLLVGRDREIATHLTFLGCEVVVFDPGPPKPYPQELPEAKDRAGQHPWTTPFDVILLPGTLESIDDPQNWLQQARHWLAVDGYVLIAVPNAGYRGVDSREAGCAEDNRYPPPQTRPKSSFTLSSLEQLALDSGYRGELAVAAVGEGRVQPRHLPTRHRGGRWRYLWIEGVERKLAWRYPHRFSPWLVLCLYPGAED